MPLIIACFLNFSIHFLMQKAYLSPEGESQKPDRKTKSTWRLAEEEGSKEIEVSGFGAINTMHVSSIANKTRKRPNPCRLLAELPSTVGEWFVMLFLLINASFAYLATSFARLCRLPEPCFQCSRLGHLVGSEGHGFCRDLLCHAHRAEISSLVYCNDHRNLADFRDMCEGCLVSSAAAARESRTENSRRCRSDSSADLQDDGNSCDKNEREDRDGVPLLDGDLETASPGSVLCSCCSAPLYANRQMKGKEKRLPSPMPVDYPVSCSKLKLVDDSESEVSFSDYDDEEERYGRCRRPESAMIIKGDVVSEKLIHQTPFSESTTTKPMDEAGSWGILSIKSTDTTETSPEQISTTCGADPAPEAEKKVPPSISVTNQATNIPIPAPRHGKSSRKSLSDKGGIIMSPRFSEMVVYKDSSRTQEDMKLRLSWALESSLSGIGSPMVDLNAPGVMALQNLAKRLTSERSSPKLEDVEGEASIDGLKLKLKQQEDLERKSVGELYRELEEERNASTIAANESMSMINRLQEEKAAMQMEALQYLRLMEDQAEYDQEANQRLNDLLNDREKEMLDMAAELESCKRRLSQVAEERNRQSMLLSRLRDTPANTPRCIRTMFSDNTPAVTPRCMNSELTGATPAVTPRRPPRLLRRSLSEDMNVMPSKERAADFVPEEPVFSFEEEKAQLSASLRRLNNMFLLQFTEQGRSEENALENEELSGVDAENSSKLCSESYREKMYLMENGSKEINDLQDEVWRLIDRVEALDADEGISGLSPVH